MSLDQQKVNRKYIYFIALMSGSEAERILDRKKSIQV